jgi:hypothetical protein
MTIFIDVAAKKNCYALMWSYGEICVRCQCCSKDVKQRRKARLRYWKSWLQESRNFNNWIPELKDIQQKNNAEHIRNARKMGKYYSVKKVK